MIKIEHKLDYTLDFNYDFNLEDVVFFDIETTGLSRIYNYIYLIGLVKFNETTGFQLIQYFSSDISEEKELLEKFINEVKDKKLITYNGESFDIPFVNTRAEKYSIKPLSNNSFDLMKYVKKNNDFLGLSNFKLKTLECFLGIFREDVHTGKDCIDFYKTYQNLPNDLLLEKILKHNFDDIYYMPKLLEILPKVNLNRSINLNGLALLIDNITINNDMLSILGSVNKNPFPDQKIYMKNYWFDITEETFSFNLETKKAQINETLFCDYINQNDLLIESPLIDETIHDIPNYLLLLTINKKPIISNIKNLVKALIEKNIQKNS